MQPVNANVTDIHDNEESPLHILLSTHSVSGGEGGVGGEGEEGPSTLAILITEDPTLYIYTIYHIHMIYMIYG